MSGAGSQTTSCSRSVLRLNTKWSRRRGWPFGLPGSGPSPMATLIVTGSFSRAEPFSSCVNPRIPIALSFSYVVGTCLCQCDLPLSALWGIASHSEQCELFVWRRRGRSPGTSPATWFHCLAECRALCNLSRGGFDQRNCSDGLLGFDLQVPSRSRSKHVFLLLLDCRPHGISSFPDPLLCHQFASHCHEDVIFLIDRLQTLRRKLAFHGQRDQQLLPHQTKTALLHRLRVVEELHFHRNTLADPPASSARLPKDVDRISSLVKQDRWEVDQVEPRLHQFRVADHSLYSTPELALIPALSGLRRHICGQHRDPDSLIQKDLFQSSSHISLLRVYRVDLAATTTRQLCFHFFNQAALLRVHLVLVQIWRLRNEEFFSSLCFRVKFPPIQIPKPKRSVRIKQQGIQRHTHHRLIPAMLLQCGLHVLFKFLVGFFQGRVHLDANDLLPVGRQRLGNIFERNERSQAHQKTAKEQR